MTKKEKLKFIETLFYALVKARVGDRGLRTDWERYCDQIEKAEREHRKYAPHGTTFGITIPQTVKLFAVQYIVEFRAGNFEYQDPQDPEGRQIVHRVPKHEVSEIFWLRLECFQAQALWETHKSEIRKAISRPDARKFIAEIDYCDLIE